MTLILIPISHTFLYQRGNGGPLLQRSTQFNFFFSLGIQLFSMAHFQFTVISSSIRKVAKVSLFGCCGCQPAVFAKNPQIYTTIPHQPVGHSFCFGWSFCEVSVPAIKNWNVQQKQSCTYFWNKTKSSFCSNFLGLSYRLENLTIFLENSDTTYCVRGLVVQQNKV